MGGANPGLRAVDGNPIGFTVTDLGVFLLIIATILGGLG